MEMEEEKENAPEQPAGDFPNSDAILQTYSLNRDFLTTNNIDLNFFEELPEDLQVELI